MPSSNTTDSNRESIAFPAFDLSCAFDDKENPTQVTIYSEADDERTTRWISIDVEHAIDVADIA